MKELEEIGINLDELLKLPKSSDDFRSMCYVIYDSFKDDTKLLKKICDVLNISKETFMDYILKYKSEIKSSYERMRRAYRKNSMYIKSGYGKPYKDFLDALLLAKDEEEIINIFETNEKGFYRSYAIFGYIINMYPNKEEANRVYNEYLRKRNIYLTHLKDIRKEKLEEGKKEYLQKKENLAFLLKDRILKNDDVATTEDILNTFNISNNAYFSIRKILAEKGENNIKEIDNKILANRIRIYNEKYVPLIRKILPLTDKNSIQEGLVKRTLDTFDCYTYFGKDITRILEVCRNYYIPDKDNYNEEIERLARLKNILSKGYDLIKTNTQDDNTEYEQMVLNKILQERKEADFQEIDEEGFLRPGSGYILSSEEKMYIFDELKKHNISISTKNYESAVRRYHNGMLHFITKETIDSYLESNEFIRKK